MVLVSSFSIMRTGSFSLPAGAAGLACLTGVVEEDIVCDLVVCGGSALAVWLR